MDRTEKVDSKPDPAINNAPVFISGDKKSIIFAGALFLFAVLGVFVLWVGAFYILSTLDIGEMQASIWPTQAPLPTATPLPNPQLHPGEILYLGTFNSPEGWQVGNTDDELTTEEKKVNNGKYIWDAVAKDGVISYSTLKTSLNIPYNDYQISVDARMVEGPSDAAYGIIFNYVDSDNYWEWAMSEDGNSFLQSMVGSKWADTTTYFKVPTYKGETNTLTMKISADELYFYVNGALMGTYKNSTPGSVSFISGKNFGVCTELNNAGDKSTVEFDNFIVSHPNPSDN